MRIHRVHCEDRRKLVRMTWTWLPPDEREEARSGPLELVCLEADECSDPLCTLFTLPSDRMKERLRSFRERRARL